MLGLRLRLIALEAGRVSARFWNTCHMPVVLRLDFIEGEELSLVPHIWFAAPKKRVSKSRKRMKTAHIGPKKISHIHECPDCGEFRKFHHLWKCCVQKAIEKTELAKKRLLQQSAPKRTSSDASRI